MARIDVSDVVLDPDFIDRLKCERKTQSINEKGRAQSSTQLIPFFGVVTNDSGDRLKRASSGEYVSSSIVVHSRFRLSPGEPDQPADVVQFSNRRYTVAGVNDYSHFGRGFVAATCDLIPLSG